MVLRKQYLLTLGYLIASLTYLAHAKTLHNIYDAKGNVIAICDDASACEYQIYTGVSRIGTVKDNTLYHQVNGPNGKAGEITRNHQSVQNSQLWIADFHQTITTKIKYENTESILLDAFGNVLNTEDSTEDCHDYTYTDKPRVDCTDLHNFNARFYDPFIGRFITTDPVEQYNLNWFTYANNNPISFIDPTGKDNDNITVKAGVSEAVPLLVEKKILPAGTTVNTYIEPKMSNAYKFVKETFGSPIVRRGTRIPYRKIIDVHTHPQLLGNPMNPAATYWAFDNKGPYVETVFNHLIFLKPEAEIAATIAHEETHARDLLNVLGQLYPKPVTLPFNPTTVRPVVIEAAVEVIVGNALKRETSGYNAGNLILQAAGLPLKRHGFYNTKDGKPIKFDLSAPEKP